MGKMLNAINRSFMKIELTFLIIGGFLVFFIMFLITINIFMRNVFGSPIVGVYEIVVQLFVALVALGFAYVQGQKGNITVEVVTDYLPQKFQKFFHLLGYVIGLFVIGIVAWQSGLQAWSSFVHQDYNANSLLKLPLWPSKAFITLGMLTLSLRLLLDILLCIFNVKENSVKQEDQLVS
ncbi:TRAP transporter small permease [Alkalihalobacillus sp. MEB130]|uniref:TRAP transporter small permease n=1 Tax=Alkalihalobacillus sp. MEB130 TaxID=2976704 RepID=UPI0028DEBEA2|nr:TRAP transporter small permease [Alkalihalobacillus sp. MEB130]MDT8860198.1 TRAP transporter small permease [Alkalihalobacillus sp. MEB130]